MPELVAVEELVGDAVDVADAVGEVAVRVDVAVPDDVCDTVDEVVPTDEIDAVSV